MIEKKFVCPYILSSLEKCFVQEMMLTDVSFDLLDLRCLAT